MTLVTVNEVLCLLVEVVMPSGNHVNVFIYVSYDVMFTSFISFLRPYRYNVICLTVVRLKATCFPCVLCHCLSSFLDLRIQRCATPITFVVLRDIISEVTLAFDSYVTFDTTCVTHDGIKCFIKVTLCLCD